MGIPSVANNLLLNVLYTVVSAPAQSKVAKIVVKKNPLKIGAVSAMKVRLRE